MFCKLLVYECRIKDSMVLIEVSSLAAPVCVSGELQTVGADNVAINYQNRVHVRYCYKGQWKSMCAGDTGNRLQTTTVICRQLGYSDKG